MVDSTVGRQATSHYRNPDYNNKNDLFENHLYCKPGEKAVLTQSTSGIFSPKVEVIGSGLGSVEGTGSKPRDNNNWFGLGRVTFGAKCNGIPVEVQNIVE